MRDRPTNIDFKYNLKIYLGLLKRYKWMFVATLVIVLVLEATSTVERYLFKILVDKGTLVSQNSLAQQAFINILIILIAVFASLVLIRVVFRWLMLHLVNKLESNIIVDLKRKFFNHILTLSHTFHTTHKTGSMISRLTRGGSAVERMSDAIIFNMAPLMFQSVIVCISLAYFDKLSALILLITAILFIGYSFFIQTISRKANIDANDAEDREKGTIADIFINVDSVKYFGKEKVTQDKYKDISDETRRYFIKNWNYYRWLDSGQSLILGVGLFFMIYFPMKAFLAGQISIGTIIFIYTLYGPLVGALFGFVHGMRDFYRVMADFESLFEYGKIENDIKDKQDAKELHIIDGRIGFTNVKFCYGARKIFNNFSLDIAKNKKIALVGHSGSGKTTLIKLLYRLYDINDGKITVDGIDVRDVHQETLRSQMSIVPQECILFDDTVYNNIAFSRPEATRAEVLSAIRFAQLDKIIKKFPNKEETIVGERGVKLSGGEKQRVSIARAILANRKILVLDEATSSLDSQTEHEIQTDLERLMKGRTSIIIAHRLSTIMKADKIIVMKNGKIVQMGNHNQLIKKPGEYKKLWNLQRGGYIR